MAKILVTGSEGLLGSLTCKKLRKKHDIIRFDLKLGQNVLKKNQLMNAVKGCDGIIHLAALSRVVKGYHRPLSAVKNNIVGTTNILECIRKLNPKIWLIYASSREVYGESKKIIKENDLLNPINVYGVTKLAGELLVKVYEKNYGLNSFIVRFSNVYGGLNDQPDRVIPRFISQASTGIDITVHGGTQTFDFVHLEDATDGLIKLVTKIKQGKLKHKTFHFVSGKGTNLMGLAKIIIMITNSRSQIKKTGARNYDVDHFIGNPNLAKSELNWETKISLRGGLERYWLDYQNQHR